MTDPFQRLAERFPEHREAIDELNEPGSNFNVLCHDYDKVADALSRAEASGEANSAVEAERLRKQRNALEQQLLAMMQQTQRV